MSEVVAITVGYPPSANRYWRVWRNRAVRTDEAEKYKEDVGWTCKQASIKPVDGDLLIRLKVFRKIKSGDLDNRIKVVLDALQGHAFHNDSQIVEIHALRFDDKKNPRVEVEIIPTHLP